MINIQSVVALDLKHQTDTMPAATALIDLQQAPRHVRCCQVVGVVENSDNKKRMNMSLNSDLGKTVVTAAVLWPIYKEWECPLNAERIHAAVVGVVGNSDDKKGE